MPQPLSRTTKKGELYFSAGALRQSKFAADVAHVIALWAHIDGDIATLLSRMLKTDIATATAMYLALNSGEAKRSVLIAAAKEALPEWQFLLLQAIMKATKPAREQRNLFAHHVWGICTELESAILLTHPKTIVEKNVSHRQPVKDLGDGRRLIAPKSLDKSAIMVYRQRDFEHAVSQSQTASGLFSLLYGVIGFDPTEQARRQLLNDPIVQQALQPLIRESSSEVQEILCVPKDGEPPPKGLYPDTWG